MKAKNPFATEYGRPPAERDIDGEWCLEEQKLYDQWEREYKKEKELHKKYPELNATKEERSEMQKLK